MTSPADPGNQRAVHVDSPTMVHRGVDGGSRIRDRLTGFPDLNTSIQD
jgi:hypothetical protein